MYSSIKRTLQPAANDGSSSNKKGKTEGWLVPMSHEEFVMIVRRLSTDTHKANEKYY